MTNRNLTEVDLGDDYYRFSYLLTELTDKNAKTFIHTLGKFVQSPKSKSFSKAVIENAVTLGECVHELLQYPYPPTEEEMQDLYDIRDGCKIYFDKFGYSTEEGKALRKAYLLLHDYVTEFAIPKDFEELNEDNKFSPNTSYKLAYKQFRDTNYNRVLQGLDVWDKLEDFGIVGNNELNDIRELALIDSLKEIKSGVDCSKGRGNLEYVYGFKTRAQLNDEKLNSVAEEVLEEQHRKHVEAIKNLEGLPSKKELKSQSWLDKAIQRRLAERK